MWTQQKLLGLLLLLGVGAALLWSPEVCAQALRPLGLRVKSACPDRELLIAELTPLLRGYTLDGESGDFVADVEDLGESYKVAVAGTSREVRDPARDCLERARVAGVFVALNLPLPAPEPLRPAPVVVSGPEIATSAPRGRDTRALELRLFAQGEAAWGAGVASTGVGLAASLRLRAWAITLLGAATTSTTPYQPSGEPTRFELHRVPFAASLGWERRLGMLGLGVEAGPALDVLRFDGKSVPHANQALRVNAGLRVNAVIRVRANRRLAAELMPLLSWFPRTYLVRVEPTQVLAETPQFWLGISLGLNCQVWGG